MILEIFTVSGDGLMLDAILWRRYRRATPGLLERTLDINPGLAALGPIIPHGTKIMIPIDPVPTPKIIDVIKLWD